MTAVFDPYCILISYVHEYVSLWIQLSPYTYTNIDTRDHAHARKYTPLVGKQLVRATSRAAILLGSQASHSRGGASGSLLSSDFTGNHQTYMNL